MENLDYCVPLGLPHSRFLSWPEEDQDKALAWQAEQRLHCPGCGTRKDEWERDPIAYVAMSERCPGCEVLDLERDTIPNEVSERAGMKTFLMTREAAVAALEQEGSQ